MGMYRKPTPENPRLETLWDERDHVRIKISLAKHAEPPNDDEVAELYDQLRDVERRIDRFEIDARQRRDN